MNAVLDYRQACDEGILRVGAKAWNMARLARWGFSAPRGLVVSVEAYDDVMQRPKVAELVARVAKLDAAAIAGRQTLSLLDDLQNTIRGNALCAAHLRQLHHGLNRAGLTGLAVAVRSSATGEDGEKNAFAGIHESYLNRRGAQEVAQAVVRCFASLWTPRAVAYRRKFGFEDGDVRGAVLICEMITGADSNEPVAAGVAFSADVSNGRRDTIVIETTPGMGDKLVSGEVTPISTRIQMKMGGIRGFDDYSGVVPRKCMEHLILMVWRLHWAFSDGETPQDIEWAFDGKKIVILQVRPVTSIPRRTYRALLDQPVIWTNANLKEVLAGIMSPMGWSPTPLYTAEHFFDIHHIGGYREPPGMQIVRRFAGHPYVDAAIIQFSAYDAWGILPAETNRSFGGFQPEIRLRPDSRAGLSKKLKQLVCLLRVLKAAWKGRKTLPAQFAKIENSTKSFAKRDLTGLSDRQLLEQWFTLEEPGNQPDFMLANAIGSLWLGIARSIGTRQLDEQQLETLIGGLMSGQGGVISAEHAFDLHRIIEQHGTAGPAFEAALDIWIEKYGHRGFNEYDIASPRWREMRDEITDMARNLGPSVHDTKSAQNLRHAAEARLRAMPFLARTLVGFTVARAREGFALRELGKSAAIAAHGGARHIILEFGRRMADLGLIEQQKDVFMLTFADVWAWARGAWDGTGAGLLVADRARQWQDWSAATPPGDVILQDSSHVEELRPQAASTGNIIRGAGVSPGIAHGVARKIENPAEPGDLHEGGILVARSTDPSWTPLFLSATGIVVEMGGYLSHSSIVAREFGLPAVVNAPGCFDAIADGSILTVDGNTGVVEIEGTRSTHGEKSG